MEKQKQAIARAQYIDPLPIGRLERRMMKLCGNGFVSSDIDGVEILTFFGLENDVVTEIFRVGLIQMGSGEIRGRD